MRVLITGGRDFTNAELIYRCLDEAREALGITEIVHGDARGVDAIAGAWALDRGVTQHKEPVPPESWQRLGGRAGNARNSLMLRKWEPDAVIGFPGGTGTTDMVLKARKAKIPTYMTWSVRWSELISQTAHKPAEDVLAV